MKRNTHSIFSSRPTWAEIDLSAINYNYRQVRKLIGKRVKILVALKADAYGHGAIGVARHLVRLGVDYFGVATIAEAIELRKAGIKTAILLLSVPLIADIRLLLTYRIIPTVVDISFARAFDRALRRRRTTMPVHIKIDTGMGRIGIWHNDAKQFVRLICRCRHVRIEGIYTHFPCAEEDASFTKRQLEVFRAFSRDLSSMGIHVPFWHAANSAAVIHARDSYCNLVRPGLMVYGLYADARSRRPLSLRPVLSFKTKIIFLKKVPRGRSISYGRTFTTKRPSSIATIPVGYADGYNRLLSNRGYVLVRGKRCPIVGKVCMDHAMIDVTGVNARCGDEVVLIGTQRGKRITAEELASRCKTISYEVVCWISKRVPRRFVSRITARKKSDRAN